jgi:hypothetical protein
MNELQILGQYLVQFKRIYLILYGIETQVGWHEAYTHVLFFIITTILGLQSILTECSIGIIPVWRGDSSPMNHAQRESVPFSA